MNAKYFGNALDLFKFDLLTHLAKADACELFYVGMITKPQPKEFDPKYLTYEVGRNNTLLKGFLESSFQLSSTINLSEIENYFRSVDVSFRVFSGSCDQTFFSDEDRGVYFDNVSANLKQLAQPTLVYFDPDIGSNIGIVRRYRSKREGYIRGEELIKTREQLKACDYLGYFQHLGNTNYTLSTRLADLKRLMGPWVLLVGYTRIQVSIVLLLNDKAQYEDKREKIKAYIKEYEDLPHHDKLIIA